MPIHVLKTYSGKRDQKGSKYMPEIVANVLRRNIHDAINPNMVWKPQKGEIPINTPIEKENANL